MIKQGRSAEPSVPNSPMRRRRSVCVCGYCGQSLVFFHHQASRQRRGAQSAAFAAVGAGQGVGQICGSSFPWQLFACGAFAIRGLQVHLLQAFLEDSIAPASVLHLSTAFDSSALACCDICLSMCAEPLYSACSLGPVSDDARRKPERGRVLQSKRKIRNFLSAINCFAVSVDKRNAAKPASLIAGRSRRATCRG